MSAFDDFEEKYGDDGGKKKHDFANQYISHEEYIYFRSQPKFTKKDCENWAKELKTLDLSNDNPKFLRSLVQRFSPKIDGGDQKLFGLILDENDEDHQEFMDGLFAPVPENELEWFDPGMDQRLKVKDEKLYQEMQKQAEEDAREEANFQQEGVEVNLTDKERKILEEKKKKETLGEMMQSLNQAKQFQEQARQAEEQKRREDEDDWEEGIIE